MPPPRIALQRFAVGILRIERKFHIFLILQEHNHPWNTLSQTDIHRRLMQSTKAENAEIKQTAKIVLSK